MRYNIKTLEQAEALSIKIRRKYGIPWPVTMDSLGIPTRWNKNASHDIRSALEMLIQKETNDPELINPALLAVLMPGDRYFSVIKENAAKGITGFMYNCQNMAERSGVPAKDAILRWDSLRVLKTHIEKQKKERERPCQRDRQ